MVPVCFQWFVDVCMRQFLSKPGNMLGYISHQVSLVHIFELWHCKIISNSNQPRGIVLSKDFIVIVNIVIQHHLSQEGISIGQVYDSFESSSFISLIPARNLVVLRRNPAVDFFGIEIMSGVHQVFVTVSINVLYISRYLILKFRRKSVK